MNAQWRKRSLAGLTAVSLIAIAVGVRAESTTLAAR